MWKIQAMQDMIQAEQLKVSRDESVDQISSENMDLIIMGSRS
jgi:hypothetical protein